MPKTEVFFSSQSGLSLVYDHPSRASRCIASLAIAVRVQVEEQQLGWEPAPRHEGARAGAVGRRGCGRLGHGACGGSARRARACARGGGERSPSGAERRGHAQRQGCVPAVRPGGSGH